MPVGFALRQIRSTNTLSNCAPVHAEFMPCVLGTLVKASQVNRYEEPVAQPSLISDICCGVRVVDEKRMPGALTLCVWAGAMLSDAVGVASLGDNNSMGGSNTPRSPKTSLYSRLHRPILVGFDFVHYRLRLACPKLVEGLARTGKLQCFHSLLHSS